MEECHKCGKENADNNQFCAECGTGLTKKYMKENDIVNLQAVFLSAFILSVVSIALYVFTPYYIWIAALSSGLITGRLFNKHQPRTVVISVMIGLFIGIVVFAIITSY